MRRAIYRVSNQNSETVTLLWLTEEARNKMDVPASTVCQLETEGTQRPGGLINGVNGKTYRLFSDCSCKEI